MIKITNIIFCISIGLAGMVAMISAQAVPSKLGDSGSKGGEPSSTKTLTNSIGMEFVLIPAGEFWMGSPDSDEMAQIGEKPRHRVTISQPFYLGKYEVTQKEWKTVMGAGNNPSRYKGDDHPVEHLSWHIIQEFIQKFNDREGREICRLPTEAQWEYAARAGSETRYSFGHDVSELSQHGWYRENAGKSTYPVGQKQANAWGLYDMYGNVWEWVADGRRTYTIEPVTDPEGPTEPDIRRIIRGGGWSSNASNARSAYRHWGYPSYRFGTFGFRCAAPASP